MAIITIKANQPVIGLPDTNYLVVPKFSISPLYAQALSNIYASFAADLFIPHDPKWTASPMSPSARTEYNSWNHCRTYIPRYQSEREINMGDRYTTDPRGLLPGERLRQSELEDHSGNKALYPQSGDLALDGEVKRAKAASSSSSCSSSSTQHVQRKPILKCDLVQEISLILYNTKVTKEKFPTPFCELPDDRFVEWVVRNLGLLGMGAWEVECEAMDVLWRTKEKRREERAVEDKQRTAENVKEDTPEMVDMRLRLDAIQKRRMEKQKEKKSVSRILRRGKQDHKEVTSVEEVDLQITKHPARISYMAWIKACLCRKR
ncbi:hypothetical protein G6011_05922 [Alternaria panax]|uniref:Uncharacterized protein n=1 Tax=Alternaria panax TaxID=48097 RepID=A0AAD4FEI0_9PLEO|nr:hypothetical protein G6011_05922 [Alternaria panax]